MRTARIVVALAFVVAAFPPASAAQDRGGDSSIAAAVRRAAVTQAAAPTRGHHHGPVVGAVIGAAGATAVTYWAARRYGENEAGGICGPCFARWGAWAIPAGALVGAGVGALVSHATAPQYAPRGRQTVISPLVGRRRAAVAVAIRY